MAKSFYTIESNSDNNRVDVTSNNELKVIDSNSGFPAGTTPVNEIEEFNTFRNKIEYEVPASKVLSITSWSVSITEGKLQLELQIDGTFKDGAGLTEDGSSFAQRSVNPSTPIAEATAGQTVRWRRESGDSGKDWCASFQGYLTNV